MKNGRKKNYEDSTTFTEEYDPGPNVLLQRYTNTDTSSSEKANLRQDKLCYPKCSTYKQLVDKDQSSMNKYNRDIVTLYQMRQLQRGSRPSHHSSSSKYSNTEKIVCVCVSVLGLMIIICTGLRYYLGTPQDRFPEVTARKEVMKDMTDEEKRSVIEYIFSRKEQAYLKTSNDSSTTDLVKTESMNRDDLWNEDVEEESSLDSKTSAKFNRKEVCTNENSEISVDTIPTRSSTVADVLDMDLNEDDVCSICLDSFGTDSKVLEARDVLCAPNCSHSFHKECIMDWFLSLSSNLTCPECRSQVFTVDELRAAAAALNDSTKNDEKDVASIRKKCMLWWKV